MKMIKTKLIRKKGLKDKGNAFIEGIAVVLIISFFLALGINIYTAFLTWQKLNRIGDEAVRMAEITGSTTSAAVEERLEDLIEATGIEPDSLSWEGTEYMSGVYSDKIQINDKIKLTLTYEYPLIGNRLDDTKEATVEFPFKTVSTGRSEAYTKE